MKKKIIISLLVLLSACHQPAPKNTSTSTIETEIKHCYKEICECADACLCSETCPCKKSKKK